MIAITGAAGFIGSCLAGELNRMGINSLVIADDFTKPGKQHNFDSKIYAEMIDRDGFPSWLNGNAQSIEFVIHLGARTDTTETKWEILQSLNLRYSIELWNICTEHEIPLIYASSAATYGGGEQGYDDNTDPDMLAPLNLYGVSKNEFDKFVLQQTRTPPFWAGLKFFNVYGPNEYHKQRMASVIFHAYNQIKDTGKVKLFKSHRSEFKDGWQMRDFVYVKDICSVITWLMQAKPSNGIYNAGTGKTESFYDLARNTAEAMHQQLDIVWIDIPEDIRDKYQYYTEANMSKLQNAGYDKPFTSLKDGIYDYVRNYLLPGNYL